MEITKHDAMKVLDTKVVKLSKFVKAQEKVKKSTLFEKILYKIHQASLRVHARKDISFKC